MTAALYSVARHPMDVRTMPSRGIDPAPGQGRLLADDDVVPVGL